MPDSRSRFAALLVAIAALVAAGYARASLSPFEPARTGGLEEVERALTALTNHRRLLVVGAHPDDEDTTLLTYVRRGLGGEAAYLSLSRGEGGQNLIGPELGVGLGLIRTEELLAARALEGTHQLFTRAFDFGYSRSLDETFERWPREALLEDAVRAVRRFKPQVVVAVFPPDERAGHGQHQASGVIAGELMEASGGPDRFPKLSAQGFPPWQPQSFFRSSWWDPEAITARYGLDAVDPLTGRSVYQIAAASRSMHRSQDMGTLQRIGRIEGGVAWESGSSGRDGDELFSGVDTRLSGIAGHLEAGPLQQQVAAKLEEIESSARACRSRLAPDRLSSSVGEMGEMVRQLADLVARVSEAAGEVEGADAVRELLSEKHRLAERGLAAAAGVVVDAVADRATVTPGSTLEVTATVWNSGSRAVTVDGIELVAGGDWRVVTTRVPEPHPRIGSLDQRQFGIEVDSAAEPTAPYFLRRPPTGDLYDWSQADAAIRGLPWGAPLLSIRCTLDIEGVPLVIERRVVHRRLDQAIGEIREPIRIVPRLEIEVRPAQLLWPLGARAVRQLRIDLRSNVDGPMHGRIHFESEPPWPPLADRDFELGEANGGEVVTVDVDLAEDVTPGRGLLRVSAELEDGDRFSASYRSIRYPHIRPRVLPQRADSELRVLDLELPALDLVGYVRGASDRVPEALTEIGLDIELLTPEVLATKDFGRFDAIVVGSRAYETDPALRRANAALLDYVRAGGLMIVQYQQYQFVEGGFAPYPMEIDRPHGRVTDETSPVEVLVPEHPALNGPNRLQASDWQEWVQERGLYFASTWDDAYQPLISLRDPGQPEEHGALLVAQVGEGVYVYTGLSFFRELPAGVPGALRLMVNLLALRSG